MEQQVHDDDDDDGNVRAIHSTFSASMSPNLRSTE